MAQQQKNIPRWAKPDHPSGTASSFKRGNVSSVAASIAAEKEQIAELLKKMQRVEQELNQSGLKERMDDAIESHDKYIKMLDEWITYLGGKGVEDEKNIDALQILSTEEKLLREKLVKKRSDLNAREQALHQAIERLMRQRESTTALVLMRLKSAVPEALAAGALGTLAAGPLGGVAASAAVFAASAFVAKPGAAKKQDKEALSESQEELEALRKELNALQAEEKKLDEGQDNEEEDK